MGEKGAFTAPVTWEEHFQGLREAVAETIKGEPGSPVAVQLLGLVRELVRIFPDLMETEDTRQDFLAPSFGEIFSFFLRRPVPWDWETMAPVLLPGTTPETGVEEDASMVLEWQGVRPANALETAAFSAVSKGLAWFIKDGMRGPVLFHGLQGLTPFPTVSPSPIPEGVKHHWGILEIVTAEDIAKGLGLPLEEVLNSVVSHGPILPWRIALGGEGPLYHPAGFPFDRDLTELLRVDAGAWNDLRFRGEIRGRAWESHFFITCRGLEVDHDQKTACFILDISPAWGVREWEEATDLETMTVRDKHREEAVAMRTAALEWTREDWTTWADSVSASLTEAMDRLGGMGARLQGHGVVESSGSATLTTEAQEGADTPLVSAVAMPQGVSALATVGEVSALGVEEVEPVLATYVAGEGFLSVRGGQQLKFLDKPAPDPAKVKNLEDVWEARLQEGVTIQEETGETPDWIEENRRRGAATNPWKLKESEKKRIREELGRSAHGVAEFASGSEPRWVRIYEDHKGKRWEFYLGGQWRFLNESRRRAVAKVLEEEEERLVQAGKTLEIQSAGALFPPLDEIGRNQRSLERVQAKREALTSWGRAIKVLAFLRKQASAQKQGTVEVDADTFKLWIWGTEEAPDNWLQTVRETLGMLLDISATIVGVTQGAGASLIAWEYRTKDAPEKGQDAARYAKGSNLVFFITLNPILLGGLNLLASTPKTLATGAQTPTFDTSEKNRREKKKDIEGMGDRLAYSPELHLDHFLEVLGEPPEVQKLGQTLADHITAAGSAVSKRWTMKPKGGKNPDGSMERHYTRQFCDLIPEGTVFHGALGNFIQNPEGGWKMAGKHNDLRRTNYSLLEFMGLDLPQGANESGRREVYLQGLKALLRVVVGWGDGILAVKLSGKWYDLGTPMEEAKLLHLLKEGRIVPFFSPGWLDKVRAAYETKTNLRLPKSRDEADAARWKKPTDEEGFPFQVQFKATMERYGLNQSQTAKVLGVSKMTVSNWITGKKPLSPESAKKVKEWMDQAPPVNP
jgi:DNA-binding transcriptional regulator YiaG